MHWMSPRSIGAIHCNRNKIRIEWSSAELNRRDDVIELTPMTCLIGLTGKWSTWCMFLHCCSDRFSALCLGRWNCGTVVEDIWVFNHIRIMRDWNSSLTHSYDCPLFSRCFRSLSNHPYASNILKYFFINVDLATPLLASLKWRKPTVMQSPYLKQANFVCFYIEHIRNETYY